MAARTTSLPCVAAAPVEYVATAAAELLLAMAVKLDGLCE